ISANGGGITLEFPSDQPLSIVWNDGSEERIRSNLEEGLYTVTIIDINGCIYMENITIEDASQATIGIFPNQTEIFCGLNSIQLEYDNSNEIIPTGIVRQYILCTNPNEPFNTQIAILENLQIDPLLFNLNTNTNYFIIAVLANVDNLGNVDPNDPCILFSNSLNIVFQDVPSALLPEDFLACLNEEVNVEVEVFNLENYTIEYRINETLFQNSNTSNNTLISFTAMEAVQIEIISISNDAGYCIAEHVDTLNINIRLPDTTIINLETCLFEEVGTFEKVEQNQFACDSIIIEMYTLLNNCDLEVTADFAPIDCDQIATTLFFNIANGEAPFQYELNALASSETINGTLNELNGAFFLDNLEAGSYQINIRDVMGNAAILDFEITAAVFPEISIEKTSATFSGFDVACNQDNSASLQVNINNASNDYSIIWSNGAMEETIESLGRGAYVVSVTDNNNCTSTDSIFISAPESISIELESTPPCEEDANGSIKVQAQGGVAPYRFR
ncbi:MAG: hypothetical protein AAGK97_12635, partial [Bacteroidota bacterium]